MSLDLTGNGDIPSYRNSPDKPFWGESDQCHEVATAVKCQSLFEMFFSENMFPFLRRSLNYTSRITE